MPVIVIEDRNFLKAAVRRGKKLEKDVAGLGEVADTGET